MEDTDTLSTALIVRDKRRGSRSNLPGFFKIGLCPGAGRCWPSSLMDEKIEEIRETLS
jgi:hypothetical protein